MSISNIDKFKKSTKFYIVQTVSGKLVKSLINLTFKMSNGIDKAIINGKIEGFISSFSDENLNNNEIIVSEIAYLLDIETASFFKIINEEGLSATFVRDLVDETKLYINMNFIFKKLYEKFEDKEVLSNSWMADTLSIPESSMDNPIKDERNLKLLVDMGLNAAFSAFKITDEFEFRKSYFSLILFDFIVNQEVRDASMYGIILDKNTKETEFAPILGNFQINMSNYSTYLFNNKIVDRSSLIRVIYKYYYESIKELSRCLNEHRNAYLKSMRLIAENCGTEDVAQQFLLVVKNNLSFISMMEDMIKLDFESENRIDYTQCTIRINQTVMKKNLLLQSKYPERIVVPKSVDEDSDDGVSISYEETPTDEGKSNVFLITTITAFVIGIIVGTVLLVMFFN